MYIYIYIINYIHYTQLYVCDPIYNCFFFKDELRWVVETIWDEVGRTWGVSCLIYLLTDSKDPRLQALGYQVQTAVAV